MPTSSEHADELKLISFGQHDDSDVRGTAWIVVPNAYVRCFVFFAFFTALDKVYLEF